MAQNWFEHDYNAATDEKVLELRSRFGAEGYGVFWMLLETMAQRDGAVNSHLIGGLSVGYGVAKDTLKAILDCCIEIGLFYNENGNIRSERMQGHVSKMKSFSDAGRDGANKRWQKERENRGAIGGANAGGNAYYSTVDKSTVQKKTENTHKERAGEPSFDPAIKPKTLTTEEKVSKIYDAYPKKVGNIAAKWAITNALARLRLHPELLTDWKKDYGADIPPETFEKWQEDVSRFLLYRTQKMKQAWNGVTNLKYCPNPERWFSDGRYMNADSTYKPEEVEA
jgi:hypothetical protein